MNLRKYIKKFLIESIQSTITVYHGTHNNKESQISQEGLKTGNMGYDSAGWYMVSTDFESALFHATPNEKSDAIVFEFKVPITNEHWKGYPYFWPPYKRNNESEWYALKQPIPSKFIKKIHKISYDVFLQQKSNGLN